MLKFESVPSGKPDENRASIARKNKKRPGPLFVFKSTSCDAFLRGGQALYHIGSGSLANTGFPFRKSAVTPKRHPQKDRLPGFNSRRPSFLIRRSRECEIPRWRGEIFFPSVSIRVGFLHLLRAISLHSNSPRARRGRPSLWEYPEADARLTPGKSFHSAAIDAELQARIDRMVPISGERVNFPSDVNSDHRP